ncbi:MAG: Glutaryl-CoA dehydrogenase, partial [uncultured Nocardioidaceae bacterium]
EHLQHPPALRAARPRRDRRPAHRRRARGPRRGPAAVRGPGRPLRRRLVGARRDRRRPRPRQGARRAGSAGHAPGGLRLRRDVGHRVRPGLPRARGERLRHPVAGLGAGVAGDVRDPPLGNGGAPHRVAAADGGRRGDRLLRPDRARRRVRPGQHAQQRATRRLGLGPRRPQDLDHQRDRRRRRRGVGPDRRRRARLRGAHRHRGLQCPGDQAQAVAARLGHQRAGARRCPPPRLRGPARGARAQGTAELPERGALRDRLGRDGRRPVLARRRVVLRRPAHPVRQADLGLPAHPAEARRHEPRVHQGGPARPAPRSAQGRRPAAPRAGQPRQAQQRPRGPRHLPHRAHRARRQRDLAGVPGDPPHEQPRERADLRGHGGDAHPRGRPGDDRSVRLPL